MIVYLALIRNELQETPQHLMVSLPFLFLASYRRILFSCFVANPLSFHAPLLHLS